MAGSAHVGLAILGSSLLGTSFWTPHRQSRSEWMSLWIAVEPVASLLLLPRRTHKQHAPIFGTRRLGSKPMQSSNVLDSQGNRVKTEMGREVAHSPGSGLCLEPDCSKEGNSRKVMLRLMLGVLSCLRRRPTAALRSGKRLQSVGMPQSLSSSPSQVFVALLVQDHHIQTRQPTLSLSALLRGIRGSLHRPLHLPMPLYLVYRSRRRHSILRGMCCRAWAHRRMESSRDLENRLCIPEATLPTTLEAALLRFASWMPSLLIMT